MASATFEDHPTDPDKVILRKPRFEEDDDIQDYKKPWVGLPTTTILDIYAETLKEHRGGSMPDGQIAFAKAIEQALKERNT
jgi:hypothetical protein